MILQALPTTPQEWVAYYLLRAYHHYHTGNPLYYRNALLKAWEIAERYHLLRST